VAVWLTNTSKARHAVFYSTELLSGMKRTEFVHSEKPASEGLPFLGISIAIRSLQLTQCLVRNDD
jgi:hypothetical protein